jgi:RNA-directed DNA polymerase
MTKPRYPFGCAAGSEVSGITAASYAFVVNLNNGNVNRNHHDNQYHALAVRAGESQDAVSFDTLYTAFRRAARGKKASVDRFDFEANWIRELLELQRRLNAGIWHPGRPKLFIERDPKAREIHAPPFVDCVAHHALMPPLEREFERTFIHDSYSNRHGKGTHAGVRRAQQFIRQVHNGQGGGFYLQLDIRSYFLSIHRPTLWALLKPRLQRAGLPQWLQHGAHALLNYPVSRTGVDVICSPAERESVPLHKRLENAAPGCGIAIGNHSSQFLANVYLDPLDQFIKHVLKVKRYLRYVDDLVLFHHDREQLEAWHGEIVEFLHTQLRLELKPMKLEPLTAGLDFLGYVIFPTHTVVRRRVVSHCRARLAAFEASGDYSPEAIERLRSIVSSYWGHFQHAASYRLRERLLERFPWLAGALVKRPGA